MTLSGFFLSRTAARVGVSQGGFTFGGNFKDPWHVLILGGGVGGGHICGDLCMKGGGGQVSVSGRGKHWGSMMISSTANAAAVSLNLLGSLRVQEGSKRASQGTGQVAAE